MPHDIVTEPDSPAPYYDADICNMVLIRIGNADNYVDEAIMSSNSTKEARAFNLLYSHVLNLVLAKGPWKCAIRRDEIEAEDDTPEHGWEYMFALEDDVIIVNDVSDSEDDPNPDLEWVREGRYILTNNEGPLYVTSVINSGGASAYDANFIELLVAWLAADLAPSLTVNETTIARLKLEKREALANALGIERKEGWVEDKKPRWEDEGR